LFVVRICLFVDKICFVFLSTVEGALALPLSRARGRVPGVRRDLHQPVKVLRPLQAAGAHKGAQLQVLLLQQAVCPGNDLES
jgi:hypothetical protein